MDQDKINTLYKVLKEKGLNSKEYKDLYKELAGEGNIVKQVDSETVQASILDEVSVHPSNYQKGESFGRKISKEMNTAGRYATYGLLGTLASLFLIAWHNPLISGLINSPARTGAIILGGIAGGKAADTITTQLSNNKYATWGEFLLDKSKKIGVPDNSFTRTVSEFTNPGYIIGGAAVQGASGPTAKHILGRYFPRVFHREISYPIGKFIGKGSRSVVYDGGKFVKKVTQKDFYLDNKGTPDGYESFSNPKETLVYVNKELAKNKVPGFVKIGYEGYVKQGNQYLPVFSQKKVKFKFDPLSNDVDGSKSKIFIQSIKPYLESKGWKENSGIFTNDKKGLGVLDIHQENATIVNDKPVIIDLDIFKFPKSKSLKK